MSLQNPIMVGDTMNYRIVQYGKDKFEVQKLNWLGFWVNLQNYNYRFDSAKAANEWLDEYLNYTVKVIREVQYTRKAK